MTEVVILGSGAAEPQVGRANACYFLQTDLSLLLDFGPGALINMLHAGIDRNRLDHFFWTHLHADHISEFIPFFFHAMCYSRENVRNDLHIYGPPGTQMLVESLMPLFPGFEKARFKVEVREIESESIQLGDTRIRALPVPHSPSMTALGYRIEHGGQTMVYSGDALYSPELIELCREADLAILEATCPVQHPVPGHMTAQEACETATRAGVKRLVLTHFHPMWRDYDLMAQCQGYFDGEIIEAKDLLRLCV